MPAKTIFITATEPSADLIGAALMAELKKSHKNLKFIGLGGPQMEAQGLKSLFPQSDVAVMGLLEVLPSIPRILNRLTQLTNLAVQQKPDLILTIDAHDFSSRLAKRLRAAHLLTPDASRLTPHIHYVAPKIWAWRQGRGAQLKNYYTHLLSDLPFEEQFFKNFGLPTTYIGHVAVTAANRRQLPLHRRVTSEKNQEKSTGTAAHRRPILALLPGSRAGEISRHWPLFLATYRHLRQVMPELAATLVLPEKRHIDLCQKAAPWSKSNNLTVTTGEARFEALQNATAALTKSGTNNLEIALLNLPAVVTYRMNSLSHFLAKYLIKVPFISLPNLILHYAGKPTAYPELIQNDATIENISQKLLPLLQNKPAATTQKTHLKALHKLMETPQPPAQMAAQIVSKYLK